jgi:hypothetical protein
VKADEDQKRAAKIAQFAPNSNVMRQCDAAL